MKAYLVPSQVVSTSKRIVLLPENEKSQRQAILRAVLKELGFSNIRDFQRAQKLAVDGYVGINTFRALEAAFMPNSEAFWFSGYYPMDSDKKQIVLHHGASPGDGRNIFRNWQNDGISHVATAVAISNDGTLIRGYDEAFFAVHIGAYQMRYPNYLALEAESVAVELANWGALQERNGKFYTWVNDYGKRGAGVEVPAQKIIKIDYKGIPYFERYTDVQVETLRRWIMLQAIRFNIPLRYEEKAFWELSPDAIAGKPGLFTHNSFVEWKTDIAPQPHIIKMLQTFNNFAVI